MHWFIKLLLHVGIVIVSAWIVPGVDVSGLVAVFLTVIVLGLLNVLIKPILLLISLPINVLTFGLFTFVINAGLILLASNIVPGFAIDSFWAALWFGLVSSVLSAVLIRE